MLFDIQMAGYKPAHAQIAKKASNILAYLSNSVLQDQGSDCPFCRALMKHLKPCAYFWAHNYDKGI